MTKKRKPVAWKNGHGVELRGVYGRSKLLRAAKRVETKRKRILQLIDAKMSQFDVETREKSTQQDHPGVASQLEETRTKSTLKAHLFSELRTLALEPAGFCSDDIRKRIWPFLLACSPSASTACPSSKGGRKQPHRDDDQVLKDIERSMAHHDVVTNLKSSERHAKRRALTSLIHATLQRNDQLYYYQGYHDVCTVFLLVLGSFPQALPLVQKVSETYHREAMRSSFETVLQANRMLFPLLRTQDEELYEHLMASEVEPFFALPWLITWFSHQIFQFDAVTRLFDVLICSHPLMALYLAASLVLQNRARVLRCECDFGAMHQLLAKLPYTMDLELTIHHGDKLLHEVPPSYLCQLSQLQTALHDSMYFQFPFEFQQDFAIPALPWREVNQQVTHGVNWLSMWAWLLAVLVLVLCVWIQFATGLAPRVWSAVFHLPMDIPEETLRAP